MIYKPSFEPVGHKYQADDGTELDSVTGIIKGGLGLYQHKRISAKAEFGTDVHQTLQYYNEHDLNESTLAEPLKPYLEQYKDACKEHKIEHLQSETMRYEPDLLFAGTIDMICKVDGKMSLIDFKTGKIEPWHGLQLGAYSKLMEREITIEKAYCLYLQADGFQLTEYDHKQGWQYFLAIMAAAKVRKALGY